jgi:hypothetical protein
MARRPPQTLYRGTATGAEQITHPTGCLFRFLWEGWPKTAASGFTGECVRRRARRGKRLQGGGVFRVQFCLY